MPDVDTTTTTADGSLLVGVEPAHHITVLPATPAAPAVVAPPAAEPEARFTAADIERIRTEEKNKVYGKVSDLETRLQTFEAERNARLADDEARAAEASAAERARVESEMSAKELLASRDLEWQQRFDALEAARQSDRLVLEKDRQFAQLQAHTERLLSEARDDILPELWDGVSGDTVEEVTASIERLKAKSASILGNVDQAYTTRRQAAPTVSAFSGPASGPLDTADPAQRQYTDAELAAMPMSKWAEVRKQMGLDKTSNDYGMFGR